MQVNPKVDLFLADGCGRCEYYATPKCKVNNWRLELEHVRQILLESPLTEELKWGVPVYTHQSKNIVIIGALKDCVTIGFFKGVLLSDPENILEKQGESVQSARIIRITTLSQVNDLKSEIARFINQAIELEASGAKVEFKKDLEPIPEELLIKFNESPAFRDAFFSLTKGKQRGYIIFFSQPKQSEFKIKRIEKCIEKILNGEGLNDKYKS